MSEEAGGSRSWSQELASLVEDTGIRYTGERVDNAEGKRVDLSLSSQGFEGDAVEIESFKDHVKGFLKSSAELLYDMGIGVKDIVQQTIVNENSVIVKKFRGPWAQVTGRLRFLNDFLPEDRDPVHAWPVIFLVLIVVFAVLNVNSEQKMVVPLPSSVSIRPPSASRVQLPDGRYMAYQEQGVPVDEARYSLIAAHSFLSSRLAVGLPGIKASLLEEFGVHLVTYDLPGFGESDPHPHRNLSSSAFDMLYIADTLGLKDKFWVVGYSGGGMHAWAALRYIPERIAGAAMFAPMVNPYEKSMTRVEKQKTWEKWAFRRKLLFVLARRFPSLLASFYRRGFLSGERGQPDKWLSLSLGKKDRAVMEVATVTEFWEKDAEESIRQGDPTPFVEEAVLQVSDWGFSLADLQVMRKKHKGKGFLSWLKFMYILAETEWTGFLGPIHIWQGTDDRVVPPVMAEYAQRVLPRATVHMLRGEGHFSYFCFCEECHRNIFFTLFGTPQGPLNRTLDYQTSNLGDLKSDPDADPDPLTNTSTD